VIDLNATQGCYVALFVAGSSINPLIPLNKLHVDDDRGDTTEGCDRVKAFDLVLTSTCLLSQLLDHRQNLDPHVPATGYSQGVLCLL
jgi:hypothetical protein